MNRSDTVFANLVVQKRLASREQVDECIEIVKKAAQTQTPTTLADTMVGKGYLSRPDADALLAQAQPGGTTKRLAGYELISELGRGGMGVVYKARQVTMERIVALKILRPSLTKDKTYIERFFHEAKSAAKLNHPNIIHVIDAGLADGYHFFAMEFVDGCTLAERLQQGRLDEPEALEIARQIALALSHAQQHGIVHRDIKPENIMLSIDESGIETAKVLDFGLAKLRESPELNEVTLQGTVIGTPYYMSPEQILGEDIDGRS
ncbi:MAG: serine/threonine protein kinase, partial [Planctomycetes bacterium]|nr:serine/threonine protein kinase [Planctomycetota bacterium]